MTESRKARVRVLREFIERTASIWARYQNYGPGGVDAGMYDGIAELAAGVQRQLDDDSAEIRDAVETVRDLSHRCACRSNGLCFITGEAGLIPRKDLHTAMDNGLAILAARVNG